MSASRPKGKGPEGPEGKAKHRAPSGDDAAPVIPDRAKDDSDEGWDRSDSGDSDDERYLRDRPPHWE